MISAHPPDLARTQTLLIVEDDPEIGYLLSVILAGEDREVVHAASAAESRQVLEERAVDLVILDLLLPDADGRGLLTELRDQPATSKVPILVVSTRTNAEIRAECYALGADAFVEKPFDPATLAADVSTRLERAAARARAAERDDLTGLLNRAGAQERLRRIHAEGAYAVVMMEIDGARRLSERFGWATMERVIALTAGVLEKATPPDATLARWVGSQFVAILPGREGEAAEREMGVLLDAVRGHPIEGPDRETFRVTLSAGLSLSDESRGADSVVQEAAACMFRAQEAGGNRGVTPTYGPASSGRPSVLVAEDDEITATILTHRLRKEGFDVVRYDNGADAYDAALSATPAVVLLDVKMPGMDGF